MVNIGYLWQSGVCLLFHIRWKFAFPVRNWLEIAGPRCGGPGGASQVAPRPSPRPGIRTLQGGAGPKFHAPASGAVRCGVRNFRPAQPRREH